MTQAAEFILDIPHEIYFTTKEPVTVKEVIKSLQGLESVLKCSKSSIEAIYDTKIDKVELYVEDIRKGSLKEKLYVRLFFKDEEKMLACIDKVREKVGENFMNAMGLGIAAVIGGALALGLFNAITHAPDVTTDSYNTTSVNITNNYYGNEAWAKGAEQTDLSADQFRELIEEKTKTHAKSLAQGAINTITPARNDKKSTITVGSSNITIDADTIKRSPDGKLNFKKLERTDPYLDIDIEIRALDLDSSTKGWAGIIPNVIEKRVKIEVESGVDTSKLEINKKVRANVTIDYTQDSASGKSRPTLITIQKLL